MAAEEDQPEPEEPAGTDEETVGAKLFGRWEVTGIEYADPSTERYITVTPVAHTMGRHASKQFQKSEISIVERLINRLMQTDENTGKKQQTLNIVRDAFEIIHERTDENPVQVLVTAVENAAPREETVRLKYGGISVPKAVDVAPQRRVDQALKFLAEGVYGASFKTPTDVEEALADQLLGAANYDVQTYAINQKEEKERVAAAAR
ncbi:30S ribosomal protein S7 [Halostella litorea]|uniref:30S ribosomal protein S7 n=1 Tax=Halostella litorea TaxID=2528831 RepID=UPI0010922B75|nr:30S ribosomal protein S7 [Halostella litorea]